MAGGIDKTFKLKFAGLDKRVCDMLELTCQRLLFTQNTGNGLSEAEMSFKIKNLMGDDYIPDFLPKKTVAQKDIQFQILDLEDEPQIQMQNHTYVTHQMNYNNRADAYTLTLKTREKCKNAVRLDDISKAYEFERLSDMVESILLENGFEILSVKGKKMIEKTPKIKEFKILRQPFIPVYQFITDEINPRAMSEAGGSGYRLYTQEGKKAGWTTLGYGAEDKEVPNEMLLDIVPMRNHQWVAESGSISHELLGYSMDKKKGVSATSGPDVTPSFGKLPLPVSSSAFTFFPVMSADAVGAMDKRCQYLEAYAAFPFVASIRGSAGWDMVPYNLKVKVMHEQGGGEVKGYPSSIRHEYHSGEYSIRITCLRDKAQSL